MHKLYTNSIIIPVKNKHYNTLPYNMFIMKIRCLLIISFVLLFVNSQAQKPDVLLDEFNQKYPQEKIHLHFDRDMYVSGETIWFKAYLLSELLPDTISSSLFVEMIDDKGKLISKKNLPVFSGTASGNFDLPDSLPAGYYTVQAYTSWMLNFDKDFIFKRKILVFNNTVETHTSSVKNDSYTINFFPEGGNMVADVANFIAFKATNANGYPVSFTGSVIDSKDNAITEIKTIHDGMGKFALIPQSEEKYFAKVKFDNGKETTIQLPSSLPQGVAIHVDKNLKGIRITLSRAAYNAIEKMPVFILGQMENHVVFKTDVTIEGESGYFTIPTVSYPSGILQITVFDANNNPLSERLTFIDNEDYTIKSYLTADTFDITKKAKNVFTFSVPDSMEGTFSVAITDNNKTEIAEDKDNIISGFLLSSDIKGYVHDPAFYFTKDDKFTKDALDLVMMTNGWRRFKWEKIASNQLPEIKFEALPYIRISGKAYTENKKDLITEGDLNFFFKDMVDSSTTFFTVPIDAQGNFRIDSLVFKDTASLYFNYNTKKVNKKKVLLKLDQSSAWPARNFFNIPRDYYFSDSLLSGSLKIKMNKNKEQLQYYNDYISKIIQLKEIKIKAKKKSPAQLVNEKYTSLVFSTPNAKIIDLINNPEPHGSNLPILIRSIPGIDITGNPPNQKIVSLYGGISISGGGHKEITIYLDEFQTDFNSIEYIPLDEIALVKYVESFALTSSNGPSLFIYRKIASDLVSTPSNYVTKFNFPGYSITKEFYSPDYSIPDKDAVPDIRTTLYWNAEILLNKDKQKETLKFYNSDDCHKMRVVIEGFNNAGRLCRIEKIIGT